ncbi:MAG: alpha/beta hydrolase [Thermoanaerobaculales bacterium]|nr:alpha/beta hydrolase [Thermoanaerobaculales bacterium]
MRVTTIAVSVTLSLSLTGCTFIRLAQDLDQMEHLGTVLGRVTTPNGTTDGVYAILFDDTRAMPEVVNVDRLSTAISTYVFVLDTRRRYTVAAFQDLNGDLKRNPGEPAVMLGVPKSLTIRPGQYFEGMDLDLIPDAEIPPGYDLDLVGMDLETMESLPLIAGQVVSLDAEIFEQENAEEGMWQPIEAWRSTGAGIYFLEEYDPAKIPVLFVHGIGGSPTDFRTIIDSLDRRLFQPWVFRYPSGARLLAIARVLKGLVDSLHRQYAFDTMYVTAHSMGGLVARSFVLQTGDDWVYDYVRLFVSFATPYNGHEAAAKGVKYMPIVVPSWLDIQPDSDFLLALRRPLPEGIPFYLFFGFNSGGLNPIMPYSSDSVVSVRSQLAPFAQEEAVDLFGYDLGHEEILSSQDVIDRYTLILDRRTDELGVGRATFIERRK